MGYTQKFKPVSKEANPMADDLSSDSQPPVGKTDLRAIINRMVKHGSSKSVSRRVTPNCPKADSRGTSLRNSLKSPTSSMRSNSPNNVSGGKGQFSPYNTMK